MGASAGIMFHARHFTPSVKSGYEQKESSYVLGSLLSSPICEPQLTAIIQEIFLVAQNSSHLQLRQNAAWAISFLRTVLWSKEHPNVDNSVQNYDADLKTVPRSSTEDSLVTKLSSWLMHLNYSVENNGSSGNWSSGWSVVHVATVAAVLICLSGAPRLPTMDWGSIVRQCMRYASQMTADSALKRGTLREECLKFSVSHANRFDPVLTFLDELSDIPRFMMLKLNLQTCLLLHLPDLTKIFSGFRLEKLFNDMTDFFSSDAYNSYQEMSLRVSCWNGLCKCQGESSLSSLGCLPNIEKCMEVLFSYLPALASTAALNTTEEWHEAVQCLQKAPREWLSDFLQVSLVNPAQDGEFDELLKKVVAKAKLLRLAPSHWLSLED